MFLRLLMFFVYVLVVPICVTSQNDVKQNNRVIQRQLISAQTGLPLQYVQVNFIGTKKQFVSDDKGYVILPETSLSDSVEFSRLSIIQKRTSSNLLIENSIIELDETSYYLEDIDVFVNQNDGLPLMINVKNSLPKTNPEQVIDYSCMVYNKLVFDIDSLYNSNDTISLKNKVVNDKSNHLLLIESLSEIKHGVPNYYNERIITGRVSGFKQPSLEYIASQIKPFAFYNKYISLLNENYLNPISTLGLKLYQFQIVDSISSESDTFIKVKFKPKNKLTFSGIKGFFLIDKSTYSIVGVEASGFQEGKSKRIFMTQNFKKADNGLWFPSLLEAIIEIKNVVVENGDQFMLLGTYNSYLTAIDFDFKWTENDNSPILLQQPLYYDSTDTLRIENYRVVPLTEKDSVTYIKVDSIGKQNNFDKAIYFGRSFAEGFIPISFLKIGFTEILDYNQQEGLSVGLGLYTSAMLSPNYTIGGFYRYGINDKSSKYGTSLSYIFSQKYQTKTFFSYKYDVIPTNSFSFLDGYPTGSSEAYKRFSNSEMDLYKSLSTSIETRIVEDIKVNLQYTFYESSNTNSTLFPYEELMNSNFKNITFNEYGIRLRWVYDEKFINAAFGSIPIASKSPYIWFNYRFFDGSLSDINFNSTKLEFQIEKSFKSGGAMETSLRFTSAKIFGEIPSSLLYSSFGTFNNSIGIETAYAFATMGSSEFYADRFVLGFLRHKIPLFSNSIHGFKPVIFLNSSIGFASLSQDKLKSFSKGYYESGILLDNLFRTVFVKYGVAGYYRYGPYHLSNEWRNWALKVSIDFSF